MAKPNIKDFDSVLCVEGYSDLLFYAEFLEDLGKTGVYIADFNGKADLIAQLDALITPQLLAEKTRIGVVMDADGNPAGTFTSFQNALATLTGQTVAAPGTWTDGTPRVGLFVAPDAGSQGEIETLVWRAWSADEANAPAKACIETFISCMQADGHSAKSPDKGLLAALLAIRNDEDPRLGPGARANVFDFTRAEFAALSEFLSGF